MKKTKWLQRIDHKLEVDKEERKKKLEELARKTRVITAKEEFIIMLLEENEVLKDALVEFLKAADYHEVRGQRTITWDTMHAAIDNAKKVFNELGDK